MSEEINYKKLIVDSGKKMVGSGLTVETWGNISAMDRRTGLVYLTPSGMDYSTITEDDVVVCDIDGNIMDGFREAHNRKGSSSRHIQKAKRSQRHYTYSSDIFNGVCNTGQRYSYNNR